MNHEAYPEIFARTQVFARMKPATIWTPGQWAIHRLMTAGLLAFAPPHAAWGHQVGFGALLVAYASSSRLSYWALLAIVVQQRFMIETGVGSSLSFFAFLLLLARTAANCGRSRESLYEITLLAGMAATCAALTLLSSLAADAQPWTLGLLSLGWVLLGVFERARWLAWCGLVASLLIAVSSGSSEAFHPLSLIVLLVWPYSIPPLLAFSPRWIPRRKRGLPLTVYYDGECGFCHRGVQFLLKEDPAGAALRFAPLQGASFAAAVPESERARLPDSIVVRDADGAILTRSAAALRIGAALGGYWRPLAALGRLLPRPLRDAAYDWIAARRKRWFAKPDGHCPLLSAEQRARFDP